MKKYTCINRIVWVLFPLTLICCQGVFVPDPIDPRLPKYTESGNNVAGAFINNDVWKSVVSLNFVSVTNKPNIVLYSNKDSMVMCFTGQSKTYPYIEFCLSGLKVHTFDDLMLLKNKKIPLDGLKNAGLCFQYRYNSNELDSVYSATQSKGVGQLLIKNVAINDSLKSAILSGTFGFTIKDSVNGIIELSYGRFDYRFREGANVRIE